MKNHLRLGCALVFSVATVIAFSTPSSATGNIVKSDLTGPWQIALRGTTGCGFVAMQANISMTPTGSGTGTLTIHGQCGDSTLTGQTFKITSLKANGSGTANLTCGSGCGWNFNIQVSPDRSKVNLVDVSTLNPGNYLEGVAVLGSPAGDVVIPDLTGSWQVTLLGQGGCGVASELVTFTLDSTGTSSNASTTYHTAGCGDSTQSGNTFTIQSLNSDGTGTAGLSCGTGCGWIFNIQVSPDRSTFNLVDVSSSNPNNFFAGVAHRSTTVGDIVKANLSRPWQMAVYGNTGCGVASMLVTFTLSTTGTATNATETYHTAGCGDTVTTGNTFTIQSLNADGSGVAGLSCGTGCGWTFNIQVAPDRSSFNVVDVSSANPGNFQVGTAIHQ